MPVALGKMAGILHQQIQYGNGQIDSRGIETALLAFIIRQFNVDSTICVYFTRILTATQMDARSNCAVREGKPYNLLSGPWCSPKDIRLLEFNRIHCKQVLWT